jgi:Spy/CpxP family protein refolding chaperone
VQEINMRHTSKWRAGLAAGLVVVAGLAATEGSALGQQVMTVRASSPVGGGGGQVTKRHLDRFIEALALNAEQRESAVAIHDAYAATVEQARKAQRDAMEEIRRAAEDSDDHGVFMERMPKVQRAYRESTEQAEKSLMSDLRSLLAPEQEERWPGVERMRRRQSHLRGGLSGEAVDLVELVYGLKLPGEAASLVSPVLDEYAIELDRYLVEREAQAREAPQFGPGRMEFDGEKMQKEVERAREASQRVVDLNNRTADKVKAMLPEDLRDRFAAEYRRRSFPRVYRPGRVSTGVEAALAMSDLDESQREALRDLRASYERDLSAANARWAEAIRASEASGQQGGLALAGGGRMMMSFGDEPEDLKEARTARRDLDERTSERLKSILRPEQRERLPKAPPPGRDDAMGEDGEGGDHMMMIVNEVREGPPPPR